MIDLHCHSTYSDGAHSPTALLTKALAADLKILALTDHDTIEGLEVLHSAARGKPIRIINGIEISARWKKYDIHVLGLNIKLPDSLQALIDEQNKNRIERALQIAMRMKQCGVDNAYTKACEIAGHVRVGRSHYARVCMDEGLVADRQSAFKRFLAKGRPAYVPTQWINMTAAIAEIVKAGGEAVLAHPSKYRLTRTKLHSLVAEFKESSGAGLEVVSGETNSLQMQEMVKLCSRFQLFASTGSDYHGDSLSRVLLGRQQKLPKGCIPIWEKWDK